MLAEAAFLALVLGILFFFLRGNGAASTTGGKQKKKKKKRKKKSKTEASTTTNGTARQRKTAQPQESEEERAAREAAAAEKKQRLAEARAKKAAEEAEKKRQAAARAKALEEARIREEEKRKERELAYQRELQRQWEEAERMQKEAAEDARIQKVEAARKAQRAKKKREQERARKAKASSAKAKAAQEEKKKREQEEEEQKRNVDTNPTAEQLADPLKAAAYLWDLDIGRLTPGKDYRINLGRGKKPYQKGDRAPNNLFTSINPKVFKRPTFRTFRALLDNYTRETGKAEVVTRAEQRENEEFLSAVVETPCMQYLFKFLKKKGKVRDMNDFMDQLYDLWFKLYRRDVRGDSCGFEHVFVGEVDDGQVKGMHNWIQLYLEEKAGRLDYKGFIYPRGKFNINHPFENEHLITIQFSWEKELKPVSTSFIGVTPEFELALYTLCYMCGKKEQKLNMGKYKLKARVYRIGRNMIGTAFPEEL